MNMTWVCMQDGLAVCHRHRKIGIAAVLLGRGRETKESVIDPAAGIRLLKKSGRPGEKRAMCWHGCTPGMRRNLRLRKKIPQCAHLCGPASPAARAGAGRCRQGRRDAVFNGCGRGRVNRTALPWCGWISPGGTVQRGNAFSSAPYVSIGCVASARQGLFENQRSCLSQWELAFAAFKILEIPQVLPHFFAL